MSKVYANREPDIVDALRQAEALLMTGLEKLMRGRGYTRSETHCYRDREGIILLYLKDYAENFGVLKKYVRIKIIGMPLTEEKVRIITRVTGGLYHVFDIMSRPVVNETINGYIDVVTEEGVGEIISEVDGVVKTYEQKMKDAGLVARLILSLKPYPRRSISYARVYKV